MKTSAAALISILLVLLISTSAFATLRCGSKVIDSKSTKDDVLANCGEPTELQERTREVRVKNCASSKEYDTDATPEEKAEADPCTRVIKVQEMYFDFGPNTYTYTLIFEDDALIEIRRGPHGK